MSITRRHSAEVIFIERRVLAGDAGGLDEDVDAGRPSPSVSATAAATGVVIA